MKKKQIPLKDYKFDTSKLSLLPPFRGMRQTGKTLALAIWVLGEAMKTPGKDVTVWAEAPSTGRHSAVLDAHIKRTIELLGLKGFKLERRHHIFHVTYNVPQEIIDLNMNS